MEKEGPKKPRKLRRVGCFWVGGASYYFYTLPFSQIILPLPRRCDAEAAPYAYH